MQRELVNVVYSAILLNWYQTRKLIEDIFCKYICPELKFLLRVFELQVKNVLRQL